MSRTEFDFSPLFRTAIGFDRMSRALDAASRVDESALSYPPYNIAVLNEDHYRIEMAIAGFTKDDLEITVEQGTLTVKSADANVANVGAEYLHRGIAHRSFERRFQLAEHIKVTNASMADGMLTIDLEREIPEALKPRSIEINTTPKKSTSKKHIEGTVA